MRKQDSENLASILEKYECQLTQKENWLSMMEGYAISLLPRSKGYIGSSFEQERDRAALQSVEYHQLQDVYIFFLKQYQQFLENQKQVHPVSIATIYSYMLYHGYLSKHHQFKAQIPTIEPLQLLGPTVFTGAGCCRHVSSFLTDLTTLMGYDSCNLATVVKIGDASLSKESSPNTSMEQHVIHATRYQKQLYLLDAFKDLILSIQADSPFPKVQLDTSISIQMMNGLFNYYQDFDILSLLQMPNGAEREINVYRKQALLFCNKAQTEFEDFYKNHHDLYEEMDAKVYTIHAIEAPYK